MIRINIQMFIEQWRGWKRPIRKCRPTLIIQSIRSASACPAHRHRIHRRNQRDPSHRDQVQSAHSRLPAPNNQSHRHVPMLTRWKWNKVFFFVFTHSEFSSWFQNLVEFGFGAELPSPPGSVTSARSNGSKRSSKSSTRSRDLAWEKGKRNTKLYL